MLHSCGGLVSSEASLGLFSTEVLAGLPIFGCFAIAVCVLRAEALLLSGFG